MKKSFSAAFIFLLCSSLFGQSGSINNTLGTGGSFNIKDGSNTFFTLDQSTGYLNLYRSLILPQTTSSSIGVIYVGSSTFIHDYWAPGTDGGNIFFGLSAGNFTMNGIGNSASYNSSVGDSTLHSLTFGNENSALGFGALKYNTTGGGNSAFGNKALYSNTTNGANCAFGAYALYSNTASSNSAFGYYAGYSLTTGYANVVAGYYAGYNLNTGQGDVALGDYAGYNLTTGSNDIIIGYDAEPSSDIVSNEITLGNGQNNSLRCNVTSITSLSDARDKKNIRDLPLGLGFLMTIKPRLFNWDRREWYKNGNPDGSKMKKIPTAGFIAQELDTAQMNAHAEWLNLVLKSNPNRLEATSGNLLPVIVKAIQQLKYENDSLKIQNLKLQNKLDAIQTSITDLVKTEVQKTILKIMKNEEESVKLTLSKGKN